MQVIQQADIDLPPYYALHVCFILAILIVGLKEVYIAKRSYPVAENLPFEQRFWKLQRISWLICVLVVIASANGLFGQGWLSEKRLKGDANLTYQQFVRAKSPSSLEIELPKEMPSLTVSVTKNVIQQYQIDHIVPEPKTVVMKDNSYAYIFEAPVTGTNSKVTYYWQAESPGHLTGTIQVNDLPTFQLNQIIYP